LSLEKKGKLISALAAKACTPLALAPEESVQLKLQISNNQAGRFDKEPK